MPKGFSFCVDMFSILRLYLGEELLGRMVILFKLLEELPDCFPTQLHHFTIPLAVCEGFDFSTFPAGFYQLPHCWCLWRGNTPPLFLLMAFKYRPTSLSLKKAPGSLAFSLT